MALTDGLVSRWLLNEGTGTSASDMHGVRNGTLSTAAWVNDGTRGQVYDSATTQRISCGSGAFVSGTGLTVAFWVNADTTPDFNGRVLTQLDTTGNYGFRVWLDGNDALRLQVSGDGTNLETKLTTGGVFTNGTWAHIIVTFSSGAFGVYVNNGTARATDGPFTITSLYASTDTVFIGSATGGTDSLDGKLSDIAVWNRALTEQERTDVYNNTWDAPTALSVEPLYYVSTLMANKSNIRWLVTEGHANLTGSWRGSGTAGTTNGSGIFTPDGSPNLGAASDEVTLHLYWEEGSDPVENRSLIFKTTLVAA